MSNSKDTASFFENGTTEQFEFCYKLYPQVLRLKAEKRCKKPQDLIRLDEWYQNQLPKLIKARGKDAHMEYDELVQTMKWKQSRGKFYPQLSYLVKVNTPRAVAQETKKAFRKLPNLEQAITALSNLKGVGTTMASALLAAAAPDSAPFMADECLMAIPEIEGIDYTTKEYLNFVNHIQTTVTRLNTEAGGETPFWSPHRVELALWAHYVANDLSPELLDEMPGPGAGGGANTNGKAKKAKVLDGGEDTNDADNENLETAGRGEINNTTRESENDNTNPPTAVLVTSVTDGVVQQDGDSNFLSNDSISQEPIIDENTTQTTATTSTDDGETGTPLASDSESNLEVPSKAKNVATNATSNIAADASAPALPKNNTNMNTNTNNNMTNNSNKLDAVRSAAATAVGNESSNGNGTLLTASGVAVSSDGKNSNCSRSSVNEEAASDDDDDEDDEEDLEEEEEEEEDDRMADESSNSNNGHSGHNKLVTSNAKNKLNDGTNNTIDNDLTHSSAVGIAIAQKRPLQCSADGVGDGSSIEEVNSQPDLKKIRSD